MKKYKFLFGLFLIILLLIIYVYTLYFQFIPDNIVMFEGETLSFKNFFGLNTSLIDDDEVVQVSSNNNDKILDSGKKTINISFLNNVFVKKVNVDVLPRTKVIPVGNIAGIKLYTSGVIVVGMTEIEGIDNKKHKPYENSGIEEGDTIISINKKRINSVDDLVKNVNLANGESVEVQYLHNEKTLECFIQPVKTLKQEYKLGLWVRDSAAGVGTVSFYEPTTRLFGALGHGIVDIDTEQLIDISSGEFVTTRILNIVKGEKGKPGRIQGTVDNQSNIGIVSKNTRFGIFGKVDNVSSLNIDNSKEMDVAFRKEVHTGNAKIMCSLENGKVEEYDIQIEKVFKDNNYDNKSMSIKVVDERLINKTGGIIQGMSGSPIIQDGKFVGAVTHVLVQNPKQGYGVFADMMIKQMREVE